MTRIIAGFAGSIRLVVPGFGTRPTSDRVREAIFSALEARDAIDGLRVLDLYSGSGALGLEAASRGAAHITLVDRNAQTSRENAARVLKQAPRDAPPTVITTGQPVQAFLNSSRDSWDLVFIDPPYDLGLPELVHNLSSLAPRLNPDAVVVLERSSRTPAPEWPEGISLERRKDYGDTALYWLAAATPSARA
ncbi:MAG: 16S rRNA (guanine(966)-N(2))-methyltransferase RsmD [Pseudolysinimonas sp.]